MKIKLLPKFILSLGVIGVILTIAISLFSYRSSRSYLENLYAQRVMTNSNSIADMMSVSDVKKILAEGGDKTEEYSEMVTLFNKLKKDGDVTYLSLVVPDEDSVHFYIDALVEELGDDPANQIAYGSDILYTDAANPDDPADMEKYITIWNQYQQNKGVDHPLVTDNSYGYNYTGISVILDENGNAVVSYGYDAWGAPLRCTGELAETLGLPVLLVVQPKGASVTLAAQIQGLMNFRKNSHVSGILLNDCSEKLYKMLKALLERETGLPVLGYLPHLPQAAVESRHLGLKTADEIADLQEKIALLADALVLDWQRLAVLTEKPAPEALPGAAAPTSVRIAVAKDEAFCFTYAETLDALLDAGAELVLFSPVQDAVLPENIGGLYLPGGYPELYAKTLSENKTMLASIRQAVQAGLPTAAECGGFLYLGRSLEDVDGKVWPMADVLPGDGIRVGRLVRFGYAEMTAKADSMLFCAGETLPIHEFHHWDSTANGTAFTACKNEKMQWECGFANENFYAGFPHLYWAGTPLPGRFVRAAERYSKTKG